MELEKEFNLITEKIDQEIVELEKVLQMNKEKAKGEGKS